MLQARIQKWGDGLALRIPDSMVAEAHLELDSVVQLALVEGKLVISSVNESSLTLESLLAGVTDENLHREKDTGPAVGNEIW